MTKALWFKVIVDNVEQKPITAASLQVALRAARRRHPDVQSLEVELHKWNSDGDVAEEPDHDPT